MGRLGNSLAPFIHFAFITTTTTSVWNRCVSVSSTLLSKDATQWLVWGKLTSLTELQITFSPLKMNTFWFVRVSRLQAVWLMGTVFILFQICVGENDAETAGGKVERTNCGSEKLWNTVCLDWRHPFLIINAAAAAEAILAVEMSP